MYFPLTPLRFLSRAVDLYGEKEGIVDGDRRFTYRQFGERCFGAANALVQAGTRAGEVVAYLGFNSHQLLESYYAIPACQAIFAPINARLTQPEILAILNDCRAALLILDATLNVSLEEIRIRCRSLRAIISLEPNDLADECYEHLLTSAAPGMGIEWTSLDETSIAHLFYTSGTSGKPRGVMHSHRSLYLHALTTAIFYNQRDAGTELYLYQLFHANGWGRPHTATMLGLKQVLLRQFRPIEVLRQIRQQEVTHVGLVPVMAEELLAAAYANNDRPLLSQITLGGAIASPGLIKRLEDWFHCTCTSGYGLTESGPVIASSFERSTLPSQSGADRFEKQASAGWPIVGCEMRVVDRAFNDVPRGTTKVGQILIRSDSVMDGYWDDPTGTQDVLQDGWLLTGDLATWDREGYLQIVDRQKDIIISGGENISSLELELALQGHPDVQECAIIAVPDEHWGETPLAIVVPSPNAHLSGESLATYLRGRLASFKIPSRWEFTSDPLPRTSNGKLQKQELRKHYDAKQAQGRME